MNDLLGQLSPRDRNAAARLLGSNTCLPSPLRMQLGDMVLAVHSNSQELLDELSHYFHRIVTDDTQEQLTVIAIDGPAPALDVDFTAWPRETGKKGHKDSYADLENSRLLRKVRTGMVFLQSQSLGIAVGQCLSQHNQLINFINSQFMNRLQQQSWLICHAAALTIGSVGIALAGFSGGGKSTLMLHLLEDPRANYVSNDRLFLKSDGATTVMHGIPKLPRVNPGTLLNNRRLRSLLPESERRRLQTLPRKRLWDFEKKYDVPIDALYGAERVRDRAELNALVILNWQHDSRRTARLAPVELTQRHELIRAIRKSPGPFYQSSDRSFLTTAQTAADAHYVSLLKNVTVYELSGTIDFDVACELIRQQLA